MSNHWEARLLTGKLPVRILFPRAHVEGDTLFPGKKMKLRKKLPRGLAVLGPKQQISENKGSPRAPSGGQLWAVSEEARKSWTRGTLKRLIFNFI